MDLTNFLTAAVGQVMISYRSPPHTHDDSCSLYLDTDKKEIFQKPILAFKILLLFLPPSYRAAGSVHVPL